MLEVDKPFNIIVTSPRNREFFAIREFEAALNDLGDSQPKVWASGISGVLLAYTSLDPYRVPYLLRDMVKKNPWQFRDVKRVIPIEFNVKTSLDEFSRVAKKIVDRIDEGSTYRIDVKRRYTTLSRDEIIESVASYIDRRVDLKNPDYIVVIEVLGPVTGVSLIGREGILSVERELLGP
ncbi:TPA: hypothetical protein EYP83_01635 [Candidatus Geothermarchaeota archaeon]|nr:hypothetical protein [Candidatus Geothermarchaeota archaeon]HIQ13102.1 hypothetical protein [Thermoprotei archaeon]